MFHDLSMLDYCLMSINRQPLIPHRSPAVKEKETTANIQFETKPLTNQTFVEYEEDV
jgi:hypothetical protein